MTEILPELSATVAIVVVFSGVFIKVMTSFMDMVKDGKARDMERFTILSQMVADCRQNEVSQKALLDDLLREYARPRDYPERINRPEKES